MGDTTQATDRLAIGRIAGVEPAVCANALDQLIEVGLVQTELGTVLSRRAALRGAAKVGAAGAVAAPILSAVIPAAAAAASTPGTGGGPGGTPCTDQCVEIHTQFGSGTTPTNLSGADGYTGPAVPAPYPYPGLIPNTSYIGPPDSGDAPPGDYQYTVRTVRRPL